MAGKKRKYGTAMIHVDAEYIKGCIREKGGVFDRISEDMGYNTSYLSFNLSKNRQTLLPVVLDYLVMNWGVDKERAIKIPEEKPSADYQELSNKLDSLIQRADILHRSFLEVQKALSELRSLWD